MKRKIGILGGTFDPPHLAHLYIAESALRYAGLEKVYFMPALNPPHKTENKVSSYDERYQMTKCCIKDNLKFEMCDAEKIIGLSKSYTADTLKYLKTQNPNIDIYFIVGMDSLYMMHTWHTPEKLGEYAKFLCFARPGFENTDIKFRAKYLKNKFNLDVSFFETFALDISSTEIRKAVRKNLNIKYIVPSPAIEYIKTHKLYMENKDE